MPVLAGPVAVHLKKLGRQPRTTAADQRFQLAVVDSPDSNRLARLLRGFKSVLIEALIPEGSVETLDVGGLRCTAKLYQDVFEAMLLNSMLRPKANHVPREI